jgi:hypothetical protein
MYGWMDGYQYIYCLPPAGGRIRSQGNKMRRLRRRPREGCGLSSLMKQNKKAKNYAVFCFAGKKKLLFYIYAVIVKQNFLKRSTNHYYQGLLCRVQSDNSNCRKQRPKLIEVVSGQEWDECVASLTWISMAENERS